MSNEIKNKERKVFLEHLPRWDTGKNKGGINWNKCIGETFKFEYLDLKGEIEIVDYNSRSRKAKLKYNDTVDDLGVCHILYCELGKILMKVTGDFKIDIGMQINDDKRDITITARKRIKLTKGNSSEFKKYYQYKCNKCGFDCGEHYKRNNNKIKVDALWTEESGILGNKQLGCACCSGVVVSEGINDLATKRPDLVKYFKYPNESKRITVSSHRNVDIVCPECGTEKSMIVSDLARRGICCSECSDGLKIPEKFIIATLKQLHVKYETQYSDIWSEGKRYDFKFNILNEVGIIESHGIQHYEESKRGRTLKEEQKNDKFKKELALSNGIEEENYIVIDCRYSDLEWIKNSILNSRLSEIFDLTNIDWDSSFEFAITNNCSIIVRDMWNSKDGSRHTPTIAKTIGVSRSSVVRYLNFWSSIGKCDYTGNNKSIEVFKDGINLGIFESCSCLDRVSISKFGTHLNFGKIAAVARGDKPQYKGYTFRYITKEEYEQRKSQTA